MNYRILEPTDMLYNEAVKIKNGDYSTYENFYNLSAPYLYGIIKSIVGDQAAQSLITELYSDIYAQISMLPDLSKFYVWAGGMATGKAYKYICDNRPQEININAPFMAQEMVPDALYMDNEAFIPADIMVQEEIKKVIKDRIDSLPVVTKAIAQYYYCHEMPIEEIGRVMGMDANAVRAQLGSVKKLLKDTVIGTYGFNNNQRLYSLGELSLVWLAFYGAIEKFAYAGVGVAGAAVAGAGISSMAGNAGGMMGTVGGMGGINAVGTAGGFGAAGVGNAGGFGVAGVSNAGGMAGGVAGSGIAGGASGIGTAGASVAAKAGLGLGAKIGIATAAVAVATGAGIGAKILIDKNKEPEKVATVTDATTEETTEEITTTQEPTTTEEPKPIPYGERFSYSDSMVYERECYKALSSDGYSPLESDYAYISDYGITYYINEISYSEPDDAGNVVVSINCSIDAPIYIIDPSQGGDYRYGYICSWHDFVIFDYYTGRVFAPGVSEDGTDESVISENDLEFGDTVYHVTYSESHSVYDNGWTFTDDGYFINCYCDYSFVLTIPEGYDGLCIGIPNLAPEGYGLEYPDRTGFELIDQEPECPDRTYYRVQ